MPHLDTDLWADHYHPGRAGYLHPRTWADGVMPLDEFPRTHQERIWVQVQRDARPARWIGGDLFQMPSRAWFEWHWTRGQKLYRDPNYEGPPRYRPPIPANLRQAVYGRDGHQCLHCGTRDDLTLDHIYPYSLGGEDTLDNLQTLCRPCNSRKGARV